VFVVAVPAIFYSRFGRGAVFILIRLMNQPTSTLPWPRLKPAHRKKLRNHDSILWLIGAGKIFYGLLLVVVGIGAFNLIGKNLSTELWHLTERWNINFHNHYIQLLFRKAALMDGKKLFFLSVMTFGYAIVFFVEGVGLMLGKYWAKWMVIMVTGSFIPGEMYHLGHEFNWLDTILLLINLACVIYLVWRIKTHEHAARPFVIKQFT
jgi:uncharacterized membrane protein (DUF2068 family)